MRTPILPLLLAAVVLPLGGCLAPWRHAAPEYTTVAAEPLHDEAKAIAKTQRAAGLFRKGRFAEAEQALQDALIADVTYGPAHNNLGNLYYTQGKYYLAAWEFEYAAKLMPDRPEPHNNLGMVYEAVDRHDKAAEYYAMACCLNRQNPVFIGNLARARLKQDEHDPEAHHLLADLLLYDTRPQWVAFARERLALADLPEASGTDERLSDQFGRPEEPEEIPPGRALIEDHSGEDTSAGLPESTLQSLPLPPEEYDAGGSTPLW